MEVFFHNKIKFILVATAFFIVMLKTTLPVMAIKERRRG